MVNLSRFALMALGALLLAMSLSAAPAEDTTAVAGPPMAVNYAADGPVRIRFSSYLERKPLQDIRLLNLPPTTGRGKENLQQIARIDADEGMVYAPGETVTIHVKANGPATLEVHGVRNGRQQTVNVDGEQAISWQLDPPGGKDDFELYQVEARQGDKVVARRGFLSLMPSGDIRSVERSMGTVGWEFIEWAYSPFDLVSGFKGHQGNHGPLYGNFDSRLQPWNWVTDIYAPDLPKQSLRIADWTKDPFAQPYAEWARWYQYVGSDLLAWKSDSWRWGEFNAGDIERLNWGQAGKRIVGQGYLSLDGKPGSIGQYENYVVANDSIFPNGMYFREWLGQIYYAATRQACEMRPGAKPRIAEADHWNDHDMGSAPVHPRMLQLYLDYLRANKLPHDDLDNARTSAELMEIVTNTGSPERRQHFQTWNTYQVNLRGRQYLWESAVRAGMDVNDFKQVDWLFGNGMVGDWIQGAGQGGRIPNDYEQLIKPWAMHEFQTDWDYMHWQSGSYRFAGQSFARMGAMIGRDILNPDVYNEVTPHASEKAREDRMYHEWCVPQNAAEHSRLFTYTSFMHYYDFNGKPRRVVTLPYSDIYRNSWNNCLGNFTDATPGAEVHAILDHRQVSEGITMEQPIGFVGVVSSTRAKDLAAGTEYIVNDDTWPWYFESLVDCGISLPAFINNQAIDKLPAGTNLIFAPHKDGKGGMEISARAGGKMITRPWKPRDRVALREFAQIIREAAGNPVKFSAMTTGYAFKFHGNQALLYVENMRSANVGESNRGLTPPPGVQEMARTATVEVDLGMRAQDARVWDLTAFLPLPADSIQADGNRLTITAPLNAGDGRLYVIIPAADVSPAVAAPRTAAVVTPATQDKYVPWADTAYEKVAYRNTLFLDTPQPYGPKNYTLLATTNPIVGAPKRIIADPGTLPVIDGAAPILQVIAPNAVVVVGTEAPGSIKQIAQQLAAALRKAGGRGTIFTDQEFDAKPVAETGRYHILAVGTVWDNEVLQRFNDPWALDRDWYYGRLGNEPAWPWMPKTGFTVGWAGDFAREDAGVGYLCADRSSYMWEARCKVYDDKKPPEQQMPLRFLFRISGSGPAGVAKAARAFADDGLLNGCLPGNTAPAGDARYTLSPERCLATLPITAPRTVDAGDGHTLRYLGWNQADAEEYEGFLGRTGIAAKRILRIKYLPEWGITNFPSSPHRANSRFELCVIECAEPAAKAVGKLAGAGAKTVKLADGATATVTAYGTHIVAKDTTLILESAPEPWGKALVEAYLKQ